MGREEEMRCLTGSKQTFPQPSPTLSFFLVVIAQDCLLFGCERERQNSVRQVGRGRGRIVQGRWVDADVILPRFEPGSAA